MYSSKKNSLQINNYKRTILLFILFVLMALSTIYCNSGTKKNIVPENENHVYLNINDSVKYVGMQTCKTCHQSIYHSFIKTGMGESFDHATEQKSAARFDKHEVIYDKYKDFYYYPFWDKDSLMIREFRLSGKDTTYKNVVHVNYIVGSGMHTNSHMYEVNGYVYQAPMTFYTQKGIWDFPPGFADGYNSRFSREIGLECMSCHNSYPNFVKGSENKFTSIPSGITCERCHGPGELHVKSIQAGHIVDTTKAIDYTIVNPAKLSLALQVDVCERCHLQGNTVLKDGKSFYDFKPGMKLSDVMDVFTPKYKGMEDEFIMASHIARLKMSKCYMYSMKNEVNDKALKPYKDALTCVTCHDPHKDVRQVNNNIFNAVCENCHGKKVKEICTDDIADRAKSNNNCVECHMPKGGTIDIPHVVTTDHYIHIPIPKNQLVKIKTFLGLYAVNDDHPSAEMKAKAYINQFEKFDANPMLLDSAKKYLPDANSTDIEKSFPSLVHLYFLKKDYQKIIFYVNNLGANLILNKHLTTTSYSNDNAWTAYRIGEAFSNENDPEQAYLFYKKATTLAPFVPEFKNKYGAALVAIGNTDGASTVFSEILKENPDNVSALTNLGYLTLLQGDADKAQHLYTKAFALNPDYEPLLMNQAGLFIYQKNYAKAKIILHEVLKKNPTNNQATTILQKLKNV
ncbi:MAG: tetratricopeptide repeat protein [Bacteroidia bacterium]